MHKPAVDGTNILDATTLSLLIASSFEHTTGIFKIKQSFLASKLIY